jgi:hypothetical protein
MIKFNKHNVTDTETKIKARVLYSLDNRIDGRKCVTIYAKAYDRNLGKIFKEYENETNTLEDYFDCGKVVLFGCHPLYAVARERAELQLKGERK